MGILQRLFSCKHPLEQLRLRSKSVRYEATHMPLVSIMSVDVKCMQCGHETELSTVLRRDKPLYEMTPSFLVEDARKAAQE